MHTKKIALSIIICLLFIAGLSLQAAEPAVNVGIRTLAVSVKEGSKGDTVTKVQKRLIELGYLTGKADGVFGPKTSAAVKAFQKKAKLTQDGIVGDATYKKLMDKSAPKADSTTGTTDKDKPSETALTAGTTGTVTTAVLNIRSGPGTSYAKLTTAVKGNSLNLTAKTSNGWYKIKLANGKEGYGSKDYIKLSSTTATTTKAGATTTKTTTVAAGSKTGKVNTALLNVRVSGSTSAKVITTLKKDTLVTIASTSNGWHKIKLSGVGYDYGYVSSQYIVVVNTPTVTTVPVTTTTKPAVQSGSIGKVTTASLNVRSSANTKGTVVDVLHKNDTVTILETSGDWYKIKYSTVTGYVNAQYIQVSPPPATTTVTTTVKTTAPPTTTAQSQTVNNIDFSDTSKSYIGTVKLSSGVLNIRSSANATASVLSSAANGATLGITGETSGWYQVTAGKVKGYASSQYITNVRVDSQGPAISFSSEYGQVQKGSSATVAIAESGVAGLSYTSANTSIATVDNSGKVTGVGAGLVTITAKTSGGRTASYTLVVYLEKSGDNTAAINALAPSANLISFLKAYEGGANSSGTFTPYKDDAGFVTIGYGHLVTSDDKFPAAGLTQAEAEALLNKDLNEVYAPAVRKFAITERLTLNQQQFDALVSFTFNQGTSIWNNMTYIKGSLTAFRIGSNVPAAYIQEGLSRYTLAGNQRWSGLYYRRMDEAEMFTKGDYKKDGSNKYTLPSGYTWK
ncbi:MAG: SH3 domain-containing protein [Oscillospiraceae bacterium]|jgi:uncharacterized protein YgiM (DUF1202 family)/GH24 family phage-related lysozyme (muramidase)|nr:SH3 domain-containing protein [Oscillospiraceae bacterium]